MTLEFPAFIKIFKNGLTISPETGCMHGADRGDLLTTIDYLTALFGRHKMGYISLSNITKGSNTFTHHVAVSELSAVNAEAYALAAARENAYLGIATRNRDLGRSQRGGKDDLLELSAFFLDIDLDGPEAALAHRAKKLPTLDQALAMLEAVGPVPNIIIDSGYGLHVYWLLDKPYPCDNSLQRLHTDFQKRYWDYAQSQGFHLDHTANLDRVLRVPGTLNYKIPDSPKAVTIDSIDTSYSYTPTLLAMTTAGPGVPTPLASGPAAVMPTLPSFDPPPARDVNDIWTNVLTHGNYKKEFKAIKAGKSFAERGSREEVLTRVCAALAYAAPTNAPEELAEMLAPSLTEWAAEPDAQLSLDEEMDKAVNRIARAQGKRLAKLESDAAFKAAIISQSRGDASPSRGPYSESELQGFANAIGVPPELLQKRWILFCGKAYFFLQNGEYVGPFAQETENYIVGMAQKYLAPAGLAFDKPTRGGGLTPKSLTELCRDYGTPVKDFEYDYARNASSYDPQTDVFHFAPCPQRITAGVFNADIDKWLRLLGGRQTDILFDWLSGLTELSRQQTALYLYGEANNGKSFLAQEAAKIWTTGTPTALKDVTAAFNDALLKCPLIHCDEIMPAHLTPAQASAMIREITGASRQPLRRKYLATATIKGAIRVIITANKDKLIKPDITDEGDDIDAIGSRIVYIHTDSAAGRFLAQLGRQETDRWANEELIAKHLVWLTQNHVRTSTGNRFITETKTASIVRHIRAQPMAGKCLEWLAQYLSDPQKNYPGIVCGSGQLYVRAGVIQQRWKNIMKDPQPPTITAIGIALRMLSNNRQVRWENQRHCIVNVDTLLDWAEEEQYGDIEIIKQRLSKPLPPEKGLQANGTN